MRLFEKICRKVGWEQSKQKLLSFIMALNVLTSDDYQDKESCKNLIAGFYELVTNRREFLDAKR